MWFGEPQPFPERLSASGQQSYDGRSCRKGYRLLSLPAYISKKINCRSQIQRPGTITECTCRVMYQFAFTFPPLLLVTVHVRKAVLGVHFERISYDDDTPLYSKENPVPRNPSHPSLKEHHEQDFFLWVRKLLIVPLWHGTYLYHLAH